MARDNDEYQLHEKNECAWKIVLEGLEIRKEPPARLTLITSAPSPPRVTPEGVVKVLRLAHRSLNWPVQLEVREPRWSSGSQSGCLSFTILLWHPARR